MKKDDAHEPDWHYLDDVAKLFLVEQCRRGAPLFDDDDAKRVAKNAYGMATHMLAARNATRQEFLDYKCTQGAG